MSALQWRTTQGRGSNLNNPRRHVLTLCKQADGEPEEESSDMRPPCHAAETNTARAEAQRAIKKLQ